MDQDGQTLSPAQQQAFDAQLARFGLSRATLSAPSIRTGDRPGGFVLSGDRNRSHLPPTMIMVRDVAHLKALTGIPDEEYASGRLSDQDISYPAPRGPRGQLPDPETLRMATAAYVQGHSVKVQDYEPLINELHMPTRIAAFASDDIVVSADSPLIFAPGDPQRLMCASITVEPGGQIIVQENATLDTQQFTVQDGGNGTPTFVVTGQDGASGAAGGAGQPGAPGDPVGIADAEDGGTGLPGIAGQAGTNSPSVTLSLGVVTGTVGIVSGGGSGGSGGQGGPGGPGGNAVAGVDPWPGRDGEDGGIGGDGGIGMDPPAGGKGGQGGAGGQGGNGGNGGEVIAYYTSVGTTAAWKPVYAGGAGAGGPGGPPGAPGSGGSPGDNGTGPAGASGIPGSPSIIVFKGQ